MYGASTEMPPSHPTNPTPAQSRILIHDRPRLSLDSWGVRGRVVTDSLTRSKDERKDEAGNRLDLYDEYSTPAMNPLDHSVLEAAYKELHAARFINLAPLAVINSTLVMHFKGM
jgi:hypothetical protein